jgi:glucosamine kinase
MSAARACLAEAGLPEEALGRIYAGIGLAGTGQRGAREMLESWRHPFAAAWFEGDAYLAYLGAFGGGDGGVVIVGTGSIGVTFRERTIRVGGYGFPVSDEGSGADLGLNALRFALRTLDGRAAPTDFSREVLAEFGGDPAALIDWMEQASATDYARYAPLVVKHADAGEPAACRLMEQAALQIGDLVDALYRSGAPRVALINGLARAIRRYMPADIEARLVEPEGDALSGGILLARRNLAAAPGR